MPFPLILCSELCFTASVESFEDGGELEAPPLTLVTSPDLRSTPTIDHGRGFGKGFGLSPIPSVGVVFTFSSADDVAGATLGILPVKELLVEFAEELVIRGFISGNFPIVMFGGLSMFEDENFEALRPRMDPPVFGISSILVCVVGSAIFEDVTLPLFPVVDEDALCTDVDVVDSAWPPLATNSLVGEVRLPDKPVDLDFIVRTSHKENEAKRTNMLLSISYNNQITTNH